ncbi:hypothetical protein B0H19DRAFT_1070757 [Mycena capillaripes]|nr:hypothetical protein B0H19DRAFT_1070757 [Mycena capillaripes]
MHGIQELRERIVKLSAEIQLQTELLKKLEHDKSLVQRQLNAILDPMVRLPLEISSEIFLQSLPPFPEPGTRNLPQLLLNVCNAWTDIVLFTPSLWTAIKITFPCTRGLEDSLRAWLQRAGNHPLSISLVGPETFDRSVMGIIWEHGQQLQHLQMCYKEEDERINFGVDDRIDFLGGQSPGPLPLLKTLRISGLTRLQYDWQGYSGPQFLQLLDLAPNLIECVFDGVEPVLDVRTTAKKLVLPCLHRLMFGGGYETYPSSDDGLLKSLTLPALETLSLRNISGGDLFAFLKRSSPPLKQLVMDTAGSGVSVMQLQDCLHLVPTLADLKVWQPHSRLMTELSAALASSSSLLPNLHTLRIMDLYRSDEFDPDAFWETLLRALSARRTRLQIVHIQLSIGTGEPPADILAAFRALVVDGIQIYIGHIYGNSNFV